MIARFKKRMTNDEGHAADLYTVDDGCELYDVIVTVAGFIEIYSANPLDEETRLSITCAVLEQEQKRGFN